MRNTLAIAQKASLRHRKRPVEEILGGCLTGVVGQKRVPATTPRAPELACPFFSGRGLFDSCRKKKGKGRRIQASVAIK